MLFSSSELFFSFLSNELLWLRLRTTPGLTLLDCRTSSDLRYDSKSPLSLFLGSTCSVTDSVWRYWLKLNVCSFSTYPCTTWRFFFELLDLVLIGLLFSSENLFSPPSLGLIPWICVTYSDETTVYLVFGCWKVLVCARLSLSAYSSLGLATFRGLFSEFLCCCIVVGMDW